MPMTQTQLADAVADKAGLSRADAKKALAALEEVVLDEIGNAEKIKIGGVVQLDVRVRPATVARPGRNPATGEEMKVMAGGVRGRNPRPEMQRASAAAAAIKWVLKNPGIATTIPSMTDNEQLDQNFRVMAEKFSEADAKILTARLEEIRPYYCRMCGQCDGQCPKGLHVANMLRYVMYADGYGQLLWTRELPRAAGGTSAGPLRRLRGLHGGVSARRARGGTADPRPGAVRVVSVGQAFPPAALRRSSALQSGRRKRLPHQKLIFNKFRYPYQRPSQRRPDADQARAHRYSAWG